MIETKELELSTKLTLGTLETNASAIKELVLAKLKNYSAENYKGRLDEAKRDKAELNAAEKALNAKRLELEREYMKPFNNFKDTINDTCKAIKEASSKINDIVKEVENQEKDEKREKINKIFLKKDFTLFSLDKIFNDKWLNKGAKLKDIEAEIDTIISKTFNDLKIIEALPKEDVALIKSAYLNSLDISSAMEQASQLKENRDRLSREAKERQSQIIQEQIKEQAEAEYTEAQGEDMSPLVAEALEEELDDIISFALVLSGTREKLMAVRKFMTEQGITYTKLNENKDGTYSTI